MNRLPILLLGLTLACGDASGATGRTKLQEDAWLEFARCLRTHGVDVADPEFLADGGVNIPPASGVAKVSREKFDVAEDACRPLLTAAGLRPPSDRSRSDEDITLEDRALAFAKCARDAGHDVPDPVIQNGDIVNWDPEKLGIDLEDPAVQRAADDCARESGFDPRKE